MTLSDEQLVDAVRDSVASRPVPGAGLEEVLQRGRRRAAHRRAVALCAGAVLAVGAAVGVQLTGLPFVSSGPLAARPARVRTSPRRRSGTASG